MYTYISLYFIFIIYFIIIHGHGKSGVCMEPCGTLGQWVKVQGGSAS